MKKRISGVLAALLMAVTMAFTGLSAEAANNRTCTIAPDIFEICGYGYNGGTKGPITITEGYYVNGSTKCNVYLVALSGTEQVENQSTGYMTDLKAGFNLDNPYQQNVVKAITENVPANSNLILAGHSLGGMIAQQVAANSTIKDGYNVLKTVTFGSPLISAGSREGDVKRLGDTSDVVPYLSASGLVWQAFGLNRENGGYGTDAVAAHCESYARSDVWGKYDITGTKNGSATLTLNMDTLTYYQSPRL